MTYEHFYAVIMAGGSGTRLWPLSRKDRPKQVLTISGDRSLFQNAVDRLEGLFPFERILVVTIAEQMPLLQKDCPEIPPENFLLEPLPRGTASVAAMAAMAIRHRDPQAMIAMLTADHLIKNDAHLRQLLMAAHDVAKEGYLVTLGITPHYAATGFGYIQKGAALGEYRGLGSFEVERFKEKPDRATAEAMIADEQHVWNSGMFIWQVDAVLEEIKRQMPELFTQIEQIDRVWGTPAKEETLRSIWPLIKPQMIDYGIMENASKIAVIPSIDLGWFDVGSWESMFDALTGDSLGNIFMSGDSIVLDTRGTLICEDSSDRLIVTVGVEDLIIVDSGNALLICDRKNAQQVRDIVKILQESGRDAYI